MRAIPILAGLVAVSTLVRSWAGLRVPSPWIAADEMIYAELGRSLWESGALEILGQDAPFYSLVHPALIGLPLAVFDTATGYDVARVLQALAMSLTALPVYFWSRTLMSERWALAAAALTLAIPGLAYSGLLMTETVFYPVMTLAAWTAARAIVTPTLAAQALFVGAVALAVLTRLQALVLVPAFVLAAFLFAAYERSIAPLRRLAPALGGVVLLGIVWFALGGIGAYEPAAETSYDFGDVVRFVVYHAGDALLLTALAPACALVLLVLASNRLLPNARAYLAVTIALSVGLITEVGIFASRYVGRLAERDLLALAPLLFMALCLWLDRGAPRPRIVTPVVALVAAALVVLLPYGRLVHKAALADAFTLVPVYELSSYELVIGLAAAVVAVLVVLYPRALPFAIAAIFVATSISASRFIEREATALRTSFFADDPAWVDAAARGDVTYFYDGEPHWNAVWSHVFWNRRIRAVVVLPNARVPGPLPQDRVTPPNLGNPEYVVSSTAFGIGGEPIAGIEQRGLLHRGLTLYRRSVDPLQVSEVTTGRQGSGDIYGPARLVAYSCDDTHSLELTLVAKGAPVHIDISRDGQPWRSVDLAPEEIFTTSVPALPRNGVCTFDVVPNGLVGSTVFAFARH